VNFDNCTRCHEPIVKRRVGGVAIVNWYPRTKIVENLCTDCARRDLTVSRSEPAAQHGSMLAGISNTHSPNRENGVAGKLAGRGRGNP
jgi:hypothetical protein